LPCCCQVEQPGLVKEAVAPPLVILGSGPAFLLGTFSQEASQSSPDPAVYALQRIQLAKAEVVVSPPQDRIYPPDDALQTLSVVASGMLSKLLFQSVFALLARPLLSPFEMIAQEVESASLGCIDDLGFVRVQ
jgi:hypothetical protein